MVRTGMSSVMYREAKEGVSFVGSLDRQKFPLVPASHFCHLAPCLTSGPWDCLFSKGKLAWISALAWQFLRSCPWKTDAEFLGLALPLPLSFLPPFWLKSRLTWQQPLQPLHIAPHHLLHACDVCLHFPQCPLDMSHHSLGKASRG